MHLKMMSSANRWPFCPGGRWVKAIWRSYDVNVMPLATRPRPCNSLSSVRQWRFIIGRSWVRAPPGESYFPNQKILIVSKNNSAVVETRLFIQLFSDLKQTKHESFAFLTLCEQVGSSRLSTYATKTRCATWFSIAVRRSTYNNLCWTGVSQDSGGKAFVIDTLMA